MGGGEKSGPSASPAQLECGFLSRGCWFMMELSSLVLFFLPGMLSLLDILIPIFFHPTPAPSFFSQLVCSHNPVIYFVGEQNLPP